MITFSNWGNHPSGSQQMSNKFVQFFAFRPSCWEVFVPRANCQQSNVHSLPPHGIEACCSRDDWNCWILPNVVTKNDGNLLENSWDVRGPKTSQTLISSHPMFIIPAARTSMKPSSRNPRRQALGHGFISRCSSLFYLVVQCGHML